MKNRQFFLLFCSIVGIIAFSLSISNYVIDYYGVFRGESQAIIKSNLINERFVKMEYLLQDCHYKKYDSYLCGSSRVQKMDTQLTGEKTYNLGVSGGMPEDCLRELKELKKYGAPIKIVYLGLDDLSCLGNYREVLRAIYRRSYDEEMNRRYSYYAELLMSHGIIETWAKEKWIHEPLGKTLLYQTGTFFVPQEVEVQIERDPSLYIGDEKFHIPTRFALGEDSRLRVCIKAILEIKQFCDENHIRFVPFFNPQHMTTYLNDDMELMNRFKKELVKISPFWDFSGVNYVTSNNYFWYETSHPRAFICDKILDTVSGQKQMTWVPDFGVYVTEENVDAFCEKAVRDREAYDPNHEQWVPSAEERAVMTKRVNYPW